MQDSEIARLKKLYPNLMQVDADEKVNDLMLQTPEKLALLEAQAKSKLRQKLQSKLNKTLARHTALDTEMQRLKQEFGLNGDQNKDKALPRPEKSVDVAVRDIFRNPTKNVVRRRRLKRSDLNLKPRYKPREFTIGSGGLSRSV